MSSAAIAQYFWRNPQNLYWISIEWKWFNSTFFFRRTLDKWRNPDVENSNHQLAIVQCVRAFLDEMFIICRIDRFIHYWVHKISLQICPIAIARHVQKNIIKKNKSEWTILVNCNWVSLFLSIHQRPPVEYWMKQNSSSWSSLMHTAARLPIRTVKKERRAQKNCSAQRIIHTRLLLVLLLLSSLACFFSESLLLSLRQFFMQLLLGHHVLPFSLLLECWINRSQLLSAVAFHSLSLFSTRTDGGVDQVDANSILYIFQYKKKQ